MSLCRGKDYLFNWKYNASFARDVEEIEIELNTLISLKENEFREEKRRANEMLQKYLKGEMSKAKNSSNAEKM